MLIVNEREDKILFPLRRSPLMFLTCGIVPQIPQHLSPLWPLEFLCHKGAPHVLQSCHLIETNKVK